MMTALKEHYSTQQEADALTTSWNLMQVKRRIQKCIKTFVYTSTWITGSTFMLRCQQLHRFLRHSLVEE